MTRAISRVSRQVIGRSTSGSCIPTLGHDMRSLLGDNRWVHPNGAPLNQTQRLRDLERLATTTHDVLVVGGGVSGVGAALDAATRGLTVGLVEQRDYASGTSSRSSKLFHGGLRYLQRLELGLVRQALAERDLMARTLCPHLVTPVSFVYPLIHPFWERFYVGTGVALYDLMAGSSPLPHHRHLGRKTLTSLAPGLRGHRGGVRFWDAMVDDARHTLMLARTASAQGAAMATSTRVTAVSGQPGWMSVEIADLETGSKIEVRTRSVINATGVWSDGVRSLNGGVGHGVRPSKGVHLVVPRDRIQSDTGLILRTEVSLLLVIPFGDHWFVGTTDTPWELGKAHPAASRRDIDYLLSWVNTVLATPLTPSDVVGVYAGLRPLLAGESDETSRLSREHAVSDDGKGMISLAGGKYTTYRLMARDAVDALSRYLERPLPRSLTHRIPLAGSGPVAAGTPGRLVTRYGTHADDVLGLIREEPALGERVVDDSPYVGAEMVYAATHEGALHLDDFLARRTRMSIETTHRGTEAVTVVADLVGPHLGWDPPRRRIEIDHYLARVAAERDSQTRPDDRTADAARMGAPDVRTGAAE